jgi:protein-S-isoprenylcysteine O-methyltransferase Ste14
MLVLPVIAFTILVPVVVSVLIPRSLSTSCPFRIGLGWWSSIGILIVALGALTYLAGLVKFVVEGKGTPAIWFAGTRNPMYCGVILAVFGQWLVFQEPVYLWYSGILCVVFHLVVALLEEPHLRRKYGVAYDRYCASTPR